VALLVTDLELSHGVGQPLCTAGAGNETNRDLWKSEATVVRCKNEVTLKESAFRVPEQKNDKDLP